MVLKHTKPKATTPATTPATTASTQATAAPVVDHAALVAELARPAQGSLRSAYSYRPLASLTPARVADILRRASMGDGRDFLLAAADIEEKDLHYASVLQTRKLAVAGLPWQVVPGDETPAAQKAAEFCTQMLHTVGVQDVVTHLLDAISKGFAVAEIVWDTHGDLWHPSAVLARESHWFQWDADTGRELRLRDGSYQGQTLPPYKFVCHTPKIRSGIPLMGGLARSALWAWVFKSYALADWAAFCELFGKPIVLGKYDPNAAQPADLAVLRSAISGIGSDAQGMIPNTMALEFVESNAKSASKDLYLGLIEYLDKQISKAVLGQTGTTDMGGSHAQSKVHDEVRTDLLHADSKALCDTLGRDLLAPLVRLNFGDTVPLPRLQLSVEEPEDMAALAEQLSKLVPLGLQVDQAWVRQKWSIPEPTAGAVLLAGGSPAPDTLPNQAQASHAQGQGNAAGVGVGPRAYPAPDPIMPAVGGMVDQLQAMVSQATTMAELKAFVLSAYEHVGAGDLVRIMAAAFALAELQGMNDAKP